MATNTKKKTTANAPEAQPPANGSEVPAMPPDTAKEPEVPVLAPESVLPGERPLPYRATVCVSLATLHKAVGIGTADMLKMVGTLRQGTEVTITGRSGPYAQIKNGLWIKEAFLEVQPLP